MNLTLKDFGLDGSARVRGLAVDSRKVEPGFIFAALPGTQLDGRDYIPQAVAAGAVAIISTPGVDTLGLPLIADDNPRLAYAKAARTLHPRQPKIIVAVTGTNGKSSTVEFLRQIWQFAGFEAACFGTLGVRTEHGLSPMSHTTPDALALHETLDGLRRNGITHAAMEASSHGLDQYRMDAVELAAAGFTNLTQDHFDYHDSVEEYHAAKARLFTELLPMGSPAVVMVDDAGGRQMSDLARTVGHAVTEAGWGGGDLRIVEIMPHAASQMLTLEVGGKRERVELPLAGEFQALNAVTALGLALVTGVDAKTGLAALGQLRGVAGRLEMAGRAKNSAPIFVDFAHTEDGLVKLLNSVRPHVEGQLRIVFGCGGDRDPDKRPKMGAAAAKFADDAIVTDDNPRTEDAATIRAAVLTGAPDATEIGDRRAAIAEGIERLQPGDCLVIAGKGHETGQIVGTEVIPFNDVDVVRELLA